MVKPVVVVRPEEVGTGTALQSGVLCPMILFPIDTIPGGTKPVLKSFKPFNVMVVAEEPGTKAPKLRFTVSVIVVAGDPCGDVTAPEM